MVITNNGEKLDSGKLEHAVITAHAWEGFSVATEDGHPATLAVLNEAGRVVESGPALVAELWDVAVLSYLRFLKGEQAVTVCSCPSGLYGKRDEP